MTVLTAVLHREDGLYVAECPEVGTVSQGATVAEAVANLKQATELYLAEFPLEAEARSLVTTFDVKEGTVAASGSVAATCVASEAVLARDWLAPEEDEAWKDL